VQNCLGCSSLSYLVPEEEYMEAKSKERMMQIIKWEVKVIICDKGNIN
jgi:hypothetical protein